MGAGPKPRKTKPWVEPIESGGRWQWRGVAKIKGRRARTALLPTEDQAFRAAQRLRKELSAESEASTGNLGAAFAALVKDAQARGLSEDGVESTYRKQSRAMLKRFWSADTLLESINADEVQWMVRAGLEQGLSPRTISKGYLRVLDKAFELADLDSPIPRVRKSMKNALRAPRYDGPFLTIPELGGLLRAMIEWTNDDDRPARRQSDDVDLTLLLMTTGIRALEFSRAVHEDIDLEGRYLHVRLAKDRTNPRSQPLAEEVLRAAGRLRDRSQPGGIIATLRRMNSMCTRWQGRLTVFEGFRGVRSLRRSYATGLRNLGAPREVVRDLMGHSHESESMLDRYVKTKEEERRHWVKLFAQAIQDSAGFAPRLD